MLNPDAKLAANVFDTPDEAPTRNGFGHGLVEAADADERVVALCADLTESTRIEEFAKKYPGRYVELGVAEQNLAALGAGFAEYGKIPFIASYASFSPGRNNEQIRTTISLNNVPVKVCGMHAGVSVGPDGATHQALEDMALMRVQPHMTVISPCDAEEARKATVAAAKHDGPVYLRFAREKTPIMTTKETPFEIGKAYVMWKPQNSENDAQTQGAGKAADEAYQAYDEADAGASQRSGSRHFTNSVVIFGTGPLLHNALLAAKQLEGEGVAATVVNVHTVKPLDEEVIVREAKAAGAVVSVEEHQAAGGLGSAIAELLAQVQPTPMEFIAVHDQFGQSGKPEELIEHYGLGASHIVEAAKKAISRK